MKLSDTYVYHNTGKKSFAKNGGKAHLPKESEI